MDILGFGGGGICVPCVHSAFFASRSTRRPFVCGVLALARRSENRPNKLTHHEKHNRGKGNCKDVRAVAWEFMRLEGVADNTRAKSRHAAGTHEVVFCYAGTIPSLSGPNRRGKLCRVVSARCSRSSLSPLSRLLSNYLGFFCLPLFLSFLSHFFPFFLSFALSFSAFFFFSLFVCRFLCPSLLSLHRCKI